MQPLSQCGRAEPLLQWQPLLNKGVHAEEPALREDLWGLYILNLTETSRRKPSTVSMNHPLLSRQNIREFGDTGDEARSTLPLLILMISL